jgi:phosphate:Na+ symporter
LVSIAGNVNAKRAAFVHVMFNVIGAIWAILFLLPMLNLVNVILPGDPWAGALYNEAIPLHVAGLHTTYNIINILIFLPFVNQFARFICFIVPDRKGELIEEKDKTEQYKFEYLSSRHSSTPELNILRVEKEIRDMAGIVSFMFSRFCTVLRGLHEEGVKDEEKAAVNLCEELKLKEHYVDDMRDILSDFLVACSTNKLNPRSESRIMRLLRLINNLKEMSEECHSISRLLEKSIRKDCVFKRKEMEELIPYVSMVEEFLSLLEEQLGRSPTPEQRAQAAELEELIDKKRKKLDKMGRKRLEAGKNVRTELLFIDLVRRIEKLGDYCYEISEAYWGKSKKSSGLISRVFKNLPNF